MPDRHRYDPNQPRVPAGDPDGGQWTSSGYGGMHDIRAELSRSAFFQLALQQLHRLRAQEEPHVQTARLDVRRSRT